MRLLSHTILLSFLAHILFLMIIRLLQPLLLHCSLVHFTGDTHCQSDSNLSYDRSIVRCQSDGVNQSYDTTVSYDRLTPFSIENNHITTDWSSQYIIQTHAYIYYSQLDPFATASDPHFNVVTIVTALLYCTSVLH